MRRKTYAYVAVGAAKSLLTIRSWVEQRFRNDRRRLCLAKTRSTCEMNDIRGGRVTSYMDDIQP